MRPFTSRLPRREVGEWTAAAFVAAAVFAVPGLLIGFKDGGLRGTDAVLGAAGLAVALVAIGLYLGRQGPEAFVFLVLGGAVAWICAIGGFILVYGADLCAGSGAATVVAWVALFAAYLGVGAWAVLGRSRPVWGLPLAVVLGVGLYVAALTLIPGGHGACSFD